MTQGDDIDVDEHQNELAEATTGAGGCLELAEAAEENRDSPTNGDSITDGSRRNFMKRAAATLGVSTAGFAALVENARAAKKHTEVHNLTGREHRSAVSQAMSVENAQRIHQYFIKQGYTPEPSNAYSLRTDAPDGTLLTVVIPYRDGDPTERVQTYLVWSNSPKYTHQAVGHHTVHHTPSDSEAYWIDEATYVHDGELATKTTKTLNFLGCSNVNWACVLGAAGAYSTTIIACGSCAASDGILIPACAECVSTILSSAGLTLGCNFCK